MTPAYHRYVRPDMIQQAVLNIVRNSVQALTESQTPNPQIRLITRIERQMTIQTKRHALVAKIKIIDNGPGIPAEVKDTFSTPWSQASKMALGWVVNSQTLINHHGGKIDVDSYPGHTEFVIYIPIDRKETDDDE